MAKEKLVIAETVDLTAKHKNMSHGMLGSVKLKNGIEYPIDSITEVKATDNDKTMGWCMVDLAVDGEITKYTVFTGDPKINCEEIAKAENVLYKNGKYTFR